MKFLHYFLVNNKMDVFFNKVLFDNKTKKQHLKDEMLHLKIFSLAIVREIY